VRRARFKRDSKTRGRGEREALEFTRRHHLTSAHPVQVSDRRMFLLVGGISERVSRD
jgi:hypothetical protein